MVDLPQPDEPTRGEHLSRLYGEIQPLQDGHRGTGRVVKHHRLKLDRAIHLTLQEKRPKLEVCDFFRSVRVSCSISSSNQCRFTNRQGGFHKGRE